MKAKEFLKQHEITQLKITALEHDIDQLYGSDVRSPQGSDGQPRGSGVGDPVGTLASKIADMRADAEFLWEQQQRIRHRIERTLYKVDDPNAFRVAWKKYIELKDWQTIADEMDKTVRTVQRIHGRALQIVQQHLDELEVSE